MNLLRNFTRTVTAIIILCNFKKERLKNVNIYGESFLSMNVSNLPIWTAVFFFFWFDFSINKTLFTKT